MGLTFSHQTSLESGVCAKVSVLMLHLLDNPRLHSKNNGVGAAANAEPHRFDITAAMNSPTTQRTRRNINHRSYSQIKSYLWLAEINNTNI